MTNADNQLDEFGKQTLDPLRSTPALNPQVASEIKSQYLLKAEAIKSTLPASALEPHRQNDSKRSISWYFIHKPVMKLLAAMLVAMVILLIGSSFTVSAAQNSLPGQALYPVKSLSEDVTLALTFPPQARLNLVLRYTNRRMNEISSLMASGKTVDDQTSNRFQQELDEALQLAAELNDVQIQGALAQIKDHAKSQGITIEDLITKLPPQADPAIQHLQDRLTEQVQLSSFGEQDPKAFRLQVRERKLQQQENKHAGQKGEQGTTSPGAGGTPLPGQDDNNHGNGKNHPTEEPNNSNPGNKQEQPGNGNHEQNPTHTPKP